MTALPDSWQHCQIASSSQLADNNNNNRQTDIQRQVQAQIRPATEAIQNTANYHDVINARSELGWVFVGVCDTNQALPSLPQPGEAVETEGNGETGETGNQRVWRVQGLESRVQSRVQSLTFRQLRLSTAPAPRRNFNNSRLFIAFFKHFLRRLLSLILMALVTLITLLQEKLN